MAPIRVSFWLIRGVPTGPEELVDAVGLIGDPDDDGVVEVRSDEPLKSEGQVTAGGGDMATKRQRKY